MCVCVCVCVCVSVCSHILGHARVLVEDALVEVQQDGDGGQNVER